MANRIKEIDPPSVVQKRRVRVLTHINLDIVNEALVIRYELADEIDGEIVGAQSFSENISGADLQPLLASGDIKNLVLFAEARLAAKGL